MMNILCNFEKETFLLMILTIFFLFLRGENPQHCQTKYIYIKLKYEAVPLITLSLIGVNMLKVGSIDINNWIYVFDASPDREELLGGGW